MIYSSLSLKELFLGVSCIWILIFLYEKKYLFAVLLLLSCFFVRPLFYSFVSAFLFYYFISLRLIKNKINFIILNLLVLFFLIYFIEEIIDQLNYFIRVYNQEDAGWGSILDEKNINFINLSLESFGNNLNLVIDKLLLNWPVPIKFKLLFLIENIILFYFIFRNFIFDFKKNKFQTIVAMFFFNILNI